MSDTLSECIRDGTFPDSNDILSADATPNSVSLLLASIANSKDELKREIQDASKDESSNVDQWIAQAKKIQDDIAKCKSDARQIVEEHERVETLRSAVRDAGSKVHLLETEIAFTKALEHELQSIAEITQVLDEAGNDLIANNPVSAVGKIVSLNTSIQNITAGQTKSLLSTLDAEVRQKSRKQLEDLLQSRWSVAKEEQGVTLTTQPDTSSQGQPEGYGFITTDNILNAMNDLDALPVAAQLMLRQIDSFAIPITSPKSSVYATSLIATEGVLSMETSTTRSDTLRTLDFAKTILQFVLRNLPDLVRDSVGNELSPKFCSSLVSVWLDPALPHNLEDLRHVEPLREGVLEIVVVLKQCSWPGYSVLTDWIEQIPRAWLAKRRMASLDAVRKAFSLARGTLRPVERIERQTIAAEEPREDHKNEEDDWNANWDDDNQETEESKLNNTEEDEASGWDFETESNHSDTKKEEPAKASEEDDAGDAWGWGDDDDTKVEPQESAPSAQTNHLRLNGGAVPTSEAQEMVLTEIYHITDIPDYILEIVGKDMADAHELQDAPSKYFDTSAPATGLAALPNLALSLFRATAPTYYSLPSAVYTLTNINLYNDILYIAQKLSENANPSSPSAQQQQQTLSALQKFARQIYNTELDTQRTILGDLLDGAQGFESCNTYPQSQSCRDAIASVTDRLRTLHASWSAVLGNSHLQQSLGSLMTTVLGKFIRDVEDLDDISEAESKQLVAYTHQILTLEDLFAPHLSAETEVDPPLPSQIALYVPNYLRFRYLQEILESSLVDIKYLWTEGELKLEFSMAEVVDLIKALFAESQHRRNAIRAIREAA